MLPIRLPRLDGGGARGEGVGARPLRFLARRIIQAMAEHATANFILGERTVPGRFLVLRLAADEEDRAEQEQQYTEAREAIEKEVLRETRQREFRLRSALDVEVRVLAPVDVESGEAAELLRTLFEEEELAACMARLGADRELILTRRLHALSIDSRPRGAAVYLDDRQLDRTTPCRIDDLPAGTHGISLSLPGYVLHEGQVEIHEEARSARQRYFADLEIEPPMRVVEVLTFPGQAALAIGGEAGESPARFRLPVGRHVLAVAREEYAPERLEFDLAPGPEEPPERIQVRLEYAGEDRDVPVGRLIIYQPDETPRPAARPIQPPWRRRTSEPSGREMRPLDRPEDTISAFFGEGEPQVAGWHSAEGSGLGASTVTAALPAPEVLGERPLYKGVLVIGREDRRSTIVPDVKLFDPGNTVSRGCHAWLHVYTDPGTGAEYNTFVIHNNSPAGILVDGQLVTESLAIGESAEIRIGVFRMEIRKETPTASVQF